MSHSDLDSLIFSTFQTETIDFNDSLTQKMDHIHSFESFQTGFMNLGWSPGFKTAKSTRETIICAIIVL